MSSDCYLTVLYDEFVHSWCGDNYISWSYSKSNAHKLEIQKREVNVGEARAYFRTPCCGVRPEKVAQCGIPSIPTKKINFNGRRACSRRRIWHRASFRRIDLSSSFKDQSKILQGDLHFVGSALISLRFPYKTLNFCDLRETYLQLGCFSTVLPVKSVFRLRRCRH